MHERDHSGIPLCFLGILCVFVYLSNRVSRCEITEEVIVLGRFLYAMLRKGDENLWS